MVSERSREERKKKASVGSEHQCGAEGHLVHLRGSEA